MNAPYKGKGPVSATFAQGGEVITTRSRFMKVPDQFTGGRMPSKETAPVEQDYGDKKPLVKSEGETKVEKTIKPRT